MYYLVNIPFRLLTFQNWYGYDWLSSGQLVGCLFNPLLTYRCSHIQISCRMPPVWTIKEIKSFENQEIINKKTTHSYEGYQLIRYRQFITQLDSVGSPIYLCNTIFRTPEWHSSNHRRIAFSSINRNHDTMPFGQFLIAPNLWILLKFSLWLLRYKLIVMLQLFAYETLGLKATNLHLPEFLTLRFNYELAENQVHQ